MSVVGNINQSLKSTLTKLIKLKGPISVAEYMRIVLTYPNAGFYMNSDVFGAKGHFTTSPEISQVFGEIVGAWILQEWYRLKTPRPLRLVEFGPGRGTLMADITRTIKKIRNTNFDIDIGFIEISPHLRKLQEMAIVDREPSLKDRIRWFENIESLDDNQEGFTTFIAHEYLDALPIHKFIRDPNSNSMKELMVDCNKDDELIFAISKKPTLSTRLLVPKDFKGDHFEVCPDAITLLDKVAAYFDRGNKGCSLICDYGFEDEEDLETRIKTTLKCSDKKNRDTFRAFKEHKSWNPLKDPGEADLTADVDFGHLKNHLNGKLVMFGTVSQRDFLLRCGFMTRMEILSRQASEDFKKDLQSGAELLINQMGQRYKFLSLFPKNSISLFENDPPAGFSL